MNVMKLSNILSGKNYVFGGKNSKKKNYFSHYFPLLRQ